MPIVLSSKPDFLWIKASDERRCIKCPSPFAPKPKSCGRHGSGRQTLEDDDAAATAVVVANAWMHACTNKGRIERAIAASTHDITSNLAVGARSIYEIGKRVKYIVD